MSRLLRSLADVDLFSGMTAEALRPIEAACVWRNVAAGCWILDSEAEGQDVFFLLRGRVRVVVSIGGVETILRDIGPGEHFGELAALDLKPRSADVLAVTDASLAVMPAAVFRAAVHDHPSVCDKLLGVLVGQIRMLANRANETAGLGMRQRLWAELLRLARPLARSPGWATLSPPPTHAELAARVASQRETVTKELGALERKGLITRTRGAILFPDPARLRAMVAAAAHG